MLKISDYQISVLYAYHRLTDSRTYEG